MRSNLQQEQISASKSLCSWLRTACIAALLFFFVLESYFLIFELPRIVTVSIQSACNEQGFCAVTQEHPHGELVFTPPIQKPSHADSINEISVLIPKPHSEPTQDIAVIIPKPHSEPVPIIHHTVSLWQRIQDCFQY